MSLRVRWVHAYQLACSAKTPPWMGTPSWSQACVLSCRRAEVNTAAVRSSGYIQRAPQLACGSGGWLQHRARGVVASTPPRWIMSCVCYRKLDIPCSLEGSRPKRKTPGCSACACGSFKTISSVKTCCFTLEDSYFIKQKLGHASCQCCGSSCLLLPVCTEHHTGSVSPNRSVLKCKIKWHDHL